jgi:hypothetical protein
VQQGVAQQILLQRQVRGFTTECSHAPVRDHVLQEKELLSLQAETREAVKASSEASIARKFYSTYSNRAFTARRQAPPNSTSI